MARISGIDLPRNKKINIALQYIYGIGKTHSKKILDSTGISCDIKVNELKEDQIIAIRDEIANNFTVEGKNRRSYLWIFRYLTGITITIIGIMMLVKFLNSPIIL